MDEFLDEGNSKAIRWNSVKNLKYPPRKDYHSKWLITAEKNVTINAGECRRIALDLGYEMSRGIVCASVTQSFKDKIALLNDLFLDRKVENMVICIYNFSKETVTVPMGETFALVMYLK